MHVLQHVSRRKKQQWLKGSCILAAVLFHVVIFFILFGSDILGVFASQHSEPREELVRDLDNEIIVELEELVIAELIEQSLEEPEDPPKKKFLKTTKDQLAGTPEKENTAIGERSTLAASNAPVVSDAPKIAAQEGEEQRNKRDIRTINGDFSDGEVEALASASQAGGRPSASIPPAPPVEEKPEVPEVSEVSDTRSEALTQDQEKLPETDDPDPEKTSTLAKHEEKDLQTDSNPFKKAEQSDLKEKEPPPVSVKEEDDALKEAEQKADVPPVRKPIAEKEKNRPKVAGVKGFQSGGRTTRLLGSISRRSAVSSQDVAASPLGRYQAAVSKAIEREWMSNCTKYREFINPGVITIRFYIDGEGGVHKARFMDVVEGSEIQKGFTLQSVNKAKIPSMPSGVKKEQNGEPLELIYNFIF